MPNFGQIFQTPNAEQSYKGKYPICALNNLFDVQVRTAMITIDAIINYLTERLLEKGLMGCVNLVLLSDHG